MINEQNPILDYLEFNVSDHCNLKCTGCALFSPISSPGYINILQHEKDMARLAILFSGINIIRLIGGEPLLNKHILDVIIISRNYFPDANLHILSNGTLLKKMSPKFWGIIRQHRVEIDITLYPALVGIDKTIEKITKLHGIQFNARQKIFFKKYMHPFWPIDPLSSFNSCKFKYSTFLRNGMISACHMPSLVYKFNDRFGTNLPTNGAQDIHIDGLSAEDILAFLAKPSEICQFCSVRPEKFIWRQSVPKLEDWCV